MLDEGTYTDFDSEPELLINSGFWGNRGVIYYYCYDWDDVDNKYIEYESFFDIPNPEINTEQQLIEGSLHDSTSQNNYKYEFIDGEFVEIEEVELP